MGHGGIWYAGGRGGVLILFVAVQHIGQQLTYGLLVSS